MVPVARKRDCRDVRRCRFDAVVFLAAFAAEHQRQKNAVAITRHILLSVDCDESLLLTFERGVDGVAFAYELMEAKRERRKTILRILSSRIRPEKLLFKNLGAAFRRKASFFSEFFRRTADAGQAPWHGADEAAGSRPRRSGRVCVQSRMTAGRRRTSRTEMARHRRIPRVRGGSQKTRIAQGNRLCRGPQRFADDIVREHGGSKEFGCDSGNLASLLLEVPPACHRRGSADVLKRITSHAVAQPADQQGNIRALPASVGMKFIHDQKPETPSGFNQLPFVRSRQDAVLPSHSW